MPTKFRGRTLFKYNPTITAVNSSTTGRMGITGPTGPTGATGPTGPTGVHNG